ncbi:MAG: hypothetical protein RIR62_3059 [Pseudomonadota bacterium]|jgi:hypothetical protein
MADRATPAAFESHLGAIRDALLRGDLQALPALASALDAGLGDLQALSAPDLERLRAEAARTAACLGAAKAGLAAARRRLAEIRAGADGLQTYDRNGQKAAAPARSLREKRL